ncbi:YjjG family noncanonical pyrimidine nucleotidase [Cochleicola gelatinilyticus]|uniref:Haloacid dehalogenase n=1 Tax=Cochleicola gelatinilyticus TaxID=1763537 RepID=A0A167IG89_9FLAO|nr:YjjG family noncanonical pyrimidine nucleotidase [Cochleicola gelatinilyticus]OAB79621.1 haloacid dehalogenase [Cochleicola gelatinilyticus]
MNPTNITDVFFDLDHTLWDFDRNSKRAFARVFSKHRIAINTDGFLKEYEPINFEYWKQYREDSVTKEELRRGRLIDTFNRFKMSFPIEQIDALAVSYIDELPIDNFLFDGTLEVLEYLSHKYTLHIITNGFEEVQQLKLKNSAIAHYFKTVTTSEEAGVKKPNPLIFSLALKKAEVVSSNCIMIGDTFEADILGAEASGMHTLYFNYRNEKIPKDYRKVNNLIEIKNIL